MANDSYDPLADNEQAYLDSGFHYEKIDGDHPHELYLRLKDAEREDVSWLFYPKIGMFRVGLKAGTVNVVEWDRFEITEVVETEKEWLFTGEINQYHFDMKPMKYLIDVLSPFAQIKFFGVKFSPLFMKYITARIEKVGDLKLYHQCNKLGFLDRWYLPDKDRIRCHPGIQAKINQSLKEMLSKPWKDEDAVKAFQAQYAATTIQYRDIIFAWGLMQLFYYALKRKTDLVPYLFLCGIGDAGITTVGKHITEKWFDHLPKGDEGDKIEALNSATTIASLKEYLSSMPIAFLFDDLCKTWGQRDSSKSLFKNILTTNSAWTIKDRESNEVSSMMYKVAPILTGNTVPELFTDPQMLMRGIILFITQKTTVEQATNYRKVMDGIPNGLIGWYLIKRTRQWTKEGLEVLYLSMKDYYPDTKSQDARVRLNTIYKLLMMGKYLAHEFFNVELDLTGLGVLINETKQVGSDELYTTVMTQIQSGDLLNEQNLKRVYGSSNEGIRSIDKTVFDPQEKWIVSGIYHHSRDGKNGIIYTVPNLIDLKKYLKTVDELSLKQLSLLLQPFFPSLEFIDSTVKKKNPLSEDDKISLVFRQAIWINMDDLK
jgi:hypothetical protein